MRASHDEAAHTQQTKPTVNRQRKGRIVLCEPCHELTEIYKMWTMSRCRDCKRLCQRFGMFVLAHFWEELKHLSIRAQNDHELLMKLIQEREKETQEHTRLSMIPKPRET